MPAGARGVGQSIAMLGLGAMEYVLLPARHETDGNERVKPPVERLLRRGARRDAESDGLARLGERVAPRGRPRQPRRSRARETEGG